MPLELSTQRMQAHVADGIGWMTFNNPARHNALSLEMWQGIGDILEHFAENQAVRVVIMRGAGGKAFVSGADISEFDEKRSNSEQRESYGKIAEQNRKTSNWVNRGILHWRRLGYRIVRRHKICHTRFALWHSCCKAGFRLRV